MPLTFLHTADWQIGKPYGSIADTDKRVRLQHQRIQCLERIAELVEEHNATAVLVAGDLFDSPSPTKATVSAMFGAIGKMKVPVIAIPGNHDFGGPGGPWQQDFVKQEAAQLAPNFQILIASEPLILDSVVIFPAPLMERMERDDPKQKGQERILTILKKGPRALAIAIAGVGPSIFQIGSPVSPGSVPFFKHSSRGDPGIQRSAGVASP